MHKVYDFQNTPCKKACYYDEEMITLVFSIKTIGDKVCTIEDVFSDIIHLSNYIYTKITKVFPDYIQKPFYYMRSSFCTRVEIEIDVPISIFNKRIVQSRIGGESFQNENNFKHIYNLKREAFKNAYLYRVITESVTSTSGHLNRFIGDLMPETINELKQRIYFKVDSNPLFISGDNVYRAVWMLLKLHYDEGTAR
jgi:hypothetical protein